MEVAELAESQNSFPTPYTVTTYACRIICRTTTILQNSRRNTPRSLDNSRSGFILINVDTLKGSFINAVAHKLQRTRNVTLDTIIAEWTRSLDAPANNRGVKIVAAKVSQYVA